MFEELHDATVVVTAGGAGIGRAIARTFGALGSFVVVNDINASTAEAVAQEIVATGGHGLAAGGDMVDREVVEQLFDRVIGERGRVDVLVNNVGLFRVSDILDDDYGVWCSCIEVNLTATYLCSRRAAVEMRRAGRGSIVNIASGVGKTGSTSSGGYGTAKAGVIGLTRSLAAELAPAVRVNAVCPGLIDTDMGTRFAIDSAAREGLPLAEMRARRLAPIPMKRLGTPQDVANACLYLASDQAAYTTGEALNVSGGLLML